MGIGVRSLHHAWVAVYTSRGSTPRIIIVERCMALFSPGSGLRTRFLRKRWILPRKKKIGMNLHLRRRSEYSICVANTNNERVCHSLPCDFPSPFGGQV